MDSIPDTESPATTGTAADTESLRAEVAELRARIDAYERILQVRDAALAAERPAPPVASAPTKAPLPPTFEIAADQLLPAHDGFYQLEWGPEGAFRWTGPGADVHFEAWLDRSAPLLATLRIFHFGTPANAKDLVLDVDGTPYPLTRVANEKVLKSDPIASRPGDGPTRLTVRVAHLHSPSQRGQADKRMLGVAFQRLRIERA